MGLTDEEIHDGYTNQPYCLNKVKCEYCFAIANYDETNIVLIIRVMDIVNHLENYEVLCKGGCHHYINISKHIPAVVSHRIKSKVDKIRFSCPNCYSIAKATNGRLIIKPYMLILEKEYVGYQCNCCRKHYYVYKET